MKYRVMIDKNKIPLKIGDWVCVEGMSRYVGVVTGFHGEFIYVKISDRAEYPYHYKRVSKIGNNTDRK